MSHTERVIEDEHNLKELKNEVDKIAKLKADYLQQKEVIISLRQTISRLQEENMNLRSKQSVLEAQSTKGGESCDFYSIRDQGRFVPRTFRLLSPQMKTGFSKTNSQLIKNQQPANQRSYQTHHYNKTQIIQNFVEDLKFELHEKEKMIMKEQYEVGKLKNKVKKYKSENEKLKSLCSEYLDSNEFLVQENEILKAQLKIESELRYKLQRRVDEQKNEGYHFYNDKIQSDKNYEREFIKMDKIYKEFEKIIQL